MQNLPDLAFTAGAPTRTPAMLETNLGHRVEACRLA